MQLNMNDFVKVKLTQDGKIILESYRWSMKYILERKGLKGFELPVPKADENGYFRFQLWNLMYIFGPYIGMGMPLPFENNEVVLVQEAHKPEDCRCHTIRTYDGQSGCLGTKEIDPCKGETCENWKPKEE